MSPMNTQPTGPPQQPWYPQGGQNQQYGWGNWQPPGGYNFPMPWQWGAAGDVMNRFAQGLPTQIPWQWQMASGLAGNMAQSGMPVSMEPWYQSRKQDIKTEIGDLGQSLAEQFGLMGLRKSTPLGVHLTREGGRLMNQFGTEALGLEAQSLENARMRQLQGMGLLQGLGGNIAGLTEAAKNRGLQAAGMLGGLGQMQFNAPMDWARNMFGMGSMLQNVYQGGLDRQYQDYMRMAPENMPWLQMGQGYLANQVPMAPQMYNPSFLSQLLNAGGSFLPFLLMGGGGGSPFGTPSFPLSNFTGYGLV